MKIARLHAAMYCALATLAACSHQSPSPTAPTSNAPTPPVAPNPPRALTPPSAFTVTFVPSVDGHNVVRMSWGYVDGASGYTVEAGTTTAGVDLLRAATSMNVYEWLDAPQGRTFVRVKATNETQASPSSTEVNLVVFDFRDFVEAIFLGSGPLTPSDGNHGCANRGVFSRFRPGSPITVRISTSVSEEHADAILSEVSQVGDFTRGQVQAAAQPTDQPDPFPGVNEVTVATLPDTAPLCRNANGGCTFQQFDGPGVIRSARVVMIPGQTPAGYVHDAVGHGVLTLCHVDSTRIGGADMSIMGSGPNTYSLGPSRASMRPRFGGIRIPSRFTDFDRAALDLVYGAGLPPGARRADFVARGLVRP